MCFYEICSPFMDLPPTSGPLPFNLSDHGTDVAAAFERWIERFEIFCYVYLKNRGKVEKYF